MEKTLIKSIAMFLMISVILIGIMDGLNKYYEHTQRMQTIKTTYDLSVLIEQGVKNNG